LPENIIKKAPLVQKIFNSHLERQMNGQTEGRTADVKMNELTDNQSDRQRDGQTSPYPYTEGKNLFLLNFLPFDSLLLLTLFALFACGIITLK
jgi:hypothetical protein